MSLRTVLVAISLLLCASPLAFGQTDTLVVHTNAVCKMCKETIEHDLSFEKGVKSVRLDLSSHKVTIVYQPGKITPDKIRQALTEIGYDADSLPANAKARNKLPDCCKHSDNH